jgi:hypothetical protein
MMFEDSPFDTRIPSPKKKKKRSSLPSRFNSLLAGKCIHVTSSSLLFLLVYLSSYCSRFSGRKRRREIQSTFPLKRKERERVL